MLFLIKTIIIVIIIHINFFVMTHEIKIKKDTAMTQLMISETNKKNLKKISDDYRL